MGGMDGMGGSMSGGPGQSTTDDSDSGGNTVLIIAAAVAGVMVVGAFVVFLLLRRKRPEAAVVNERQAAFENPMYGEAEGGVPREGLYDDLPAPPGMAGADTDGDYAEVVPPMYQAAGDDGDGYLDVAGHNDPKPEYFDVSGAPPDDERA